MNVSRRRFISSAATLAAAGATSLLLSPVAAYANEKVQPYLTSSPAKRVFVYWRSYGFTSEVWVRGAGSSKTAESVTRLECYSGNAPVGYYGGQSRLYRSSGTLLTSTGMVYNTSKVASFYVYSSRKSGAGQYYALNKASFYNGNGYTTYTGNKSPIQTLSSSSADSMPEAALKTSYEINGNGESYGSGLSEYTIGYEPDLIQAESSDGISGYVRSSDLNDSTLTFDEVQSGNSVLFIPLYEKDGITKIGEFVLASNVSSL